jgi:hypothetical protein
MSDFSPLLGEQRTTFARSELFRVWTIPLTDILGGGLLTSINSDLARCAFKLFRKGNEDDGHSAILRSRPANFPL